MEYCLNKEQAGGWDFGFGVRVSVFRRWFGVGELKGGGG